MEQDNDMDQQVLEMSMFLQLVLSELDGLFYGALAFTIYKEISVDVAVKEIFLVVSWVPLLCWIFFGHYEDLLLMFLPFFLCSELIHLFVS